MARVLLTGADGFIGRALSARLRDAGHAVRCVVRNRAEGDAIAIGDIGDRVAWGPLLEGVDAIVHLAARAHVLHERLPDPLEEFRRVNVGGTLQLARAAVAAGVSRFVFLSSIGVNGVSTGEGSFCESDEPNPTEPYAISKWEAESGLMELATSSPLELVRVRPPLVLGPGAKGNLHRLMRLVDTGFPLPLGAIRNSRSFVSIEDICELLSLCITHERAPGELFLAASDETLSTPELLRAIARGLGRRTLLINIPTSLLDFGARFAGLDAELQRMAASLRVNTDRVAQILGWRARTPFEASIRAMAHYYLRERGS